MGESNTTRNYYNGEYFISLQRYIAEASGIFAPIMYINFLSILVFSTLCVLYIIPKLWRDYRNEKITSKLRNSQRGYYKYLLKLNLKVYISLTSLSVLFIIATIFELLAVYNICIVLILFY